MGLLKKPFTLTSDASQLYKRQRKLDKISKSFWEESAKDTTPMGGVVTSKKAVKRNSNK